MCLVDMVHNDDDTDPYSSWPAVSRTSRRATSSSMTHCFRYESVAITIPDDKRQIDGERGYVVRGAAVVASPSIVGSYSSTK